MSEPRYVANLVWQIADLLRETFVSSQYERIVLPMTVLRRFDCVLAPTKGKVLAEYERHKGGKVIDDALDRRLNLLAGQPFHNHSPFDFEKLTSGAERIEEHLVSYIKGFSANVRELFELFELEHAIKKMHRAGILHRVVSKFCDVDLRQDTVSNDQMGIIFENLVLRSGELSVEIAGEHITPRDVSRLMVNLLFVEDEGILSVPGVERKLLDPVCGTGGLLVEAQNYMRDRHPQARLQVFGQEHNDYVYAKAAAYMLMTGVDQRDSGKNIRLGDALTEDQFKEAPHDKFDYLLAAPPLGANWRHQQKRIQDEHKNLGMSGRFGAGLPRVSDGSLLFLQHMISKFEPHGPEHREHGSRQAILFNGSPLFAGGAGSGESDIRKWIIENDWLEAVIALPEQILYNTGIGTYIWIVTNRKEKRRRGKIQLIDAREFYVLMRRSIGNKRRKIGERGDERNHLSEIVQIHERFEASEVSKISDNADFGYTRVTVERPLRLRYQMTAEAKAQFLEVCPHLLEDVQAIDKALGRDPQRDWNIASRRIENVAEWPWKALERRFFRAVFTQRDPEAEPVAQDDSVEMDPDLRDFENVPSQESVDAYFEREVLPHVPDAWIDHRRDKVGYEINFNRHFYHHSRPRSLEKIEADLRRADEELTRSLRESDLRRKSMAHTVVRGLDTGGALRDSGFPWLGRIPAHWGATRLKFLSAVPLAYGADEAALDDDPAFPRCIRIADVDPDGNLRDETFRSLSPELAEHYLLKDGDVLLTRSGAALGTALVYKPSWGVACFSSHLVRVRCNLSLLRPDFFHAYAKSESYSWQVREGTISTVTPSFGVEKYRDLVVPVPPLKEQEAIMEHLRTASGELDALRVATARFVELIQEHRKALVTATTTGQLQVGSRT